MEISTWACALSLPGVNPIMEIVGGAVEGTGAGKSAAAPVVGAAIALAPLGRPTFI